MMVLEGLKPGDQRIRAIVVEAVGAAGGDLDITGGTTHVEVRRRFREADPAEACEIRVWSFPIPVLEPGRVVLPLD